MVEHVEEGNCQLRLLLLPFARQEVLETVFGLRKPEKKQDEAESPNQRARAVTERPFTVRCEVSPMLESQVDYKTDKSSYADNLIAGVIGLGMLGIVGWLALVFYAPHKKSLTTERRTALEKARIAVARVIE